MKWWQLTKRDADLERELRSDLELEEEEQRENGLSPEEARHAARRAFGNTTLIRQQTHEAWAGRQLNGFCRMLDIHSTTAPDTWVHACRPAHHGMRHRRQHGRLQHPRFGFCCTPMLSAILGRSWSGARCFRR
jgi:hypothetical protein